MEEYLWLKTILDGRQLLMEDNLWWKTTFDGTQPLMEDDRWRKTPLDRALPLMEDGFWWNLIFDGSQPLMEGNLWWKATLDWGWPLIKANVWWKTTFKVRLFIETFQDSALLYTTIAGIFSCKATQHLTLYVCFSVPNFSYIVEEVIEVDELDEGNIYAAAGK